MWYTWYKCHMVHVQMNKTLYLKDEDGPIWDRARELSNDKVSQIVVSALKNFISEKEAESAGYERIIVEYDDLNDGNRPKRKAFYGRWLIPPEESFRSNQFVGHYFAVGVTAKGGVVFCEHDTLSTATRQRLHAFPSFEDAIEAIGDDIFGARSALHEAIRRRGIPIEELDV